MIFYRIVIWWCQYLCDACKVYYIRLKFISQNINENLIIFAPIVAIREIENIYVPLIRRITIFKYAVAATVTALLGLGIYRLSNQTLPVQDVALASVIASAKNINKSNSFDKEMTSLNEDEIVGYLNEKGDDVNAALVASLSDEQSLPEEEDYLTDENKLDDYLNEFNLSK